MSVRYRGWRFIVPRTGEPGEAVGLRMDASGAIATVTDDDAVRQSLLLLISTRPGERIMRPEYGCYLHRLVFAPNDDTTAGLAMHYVRQAVERWEPRAQILDVDATRAPEDPTALDVVLEYRVRATLRQDSIAVTVPLQEAGL